MVEAFGTLADGDAVRRIRLTGGGLTAHVLTYGAVLQDLRLEGHAPPLVLGYERFGDYLAHSPYFGATPGRFSNRIGNGRFELDGRQYQLDLNQNGEHHLHGGSVGFGKRNWRIAAQDEASVRLELDSVDGDMGYPGACRVATTYKLGEEGLLSIVHETSSDAPTIANITHHSYFNLDGRDTILDHELMLAADAYLPTGQGQIPTGEVREVADTPFDFRDMRPIRRLDGGSQVPYDHNFCLSDGRVRKRTVALLRSLHSGVVMEARSTEPGVQFYCGFKLDTPVPGLLGKPYEAFGGLCLEMQVWPDSPNHRNFPSAVLRPGETLRQETDYVFSRS